MDEITFAEQFVQQGPPTLGGVLARLATPDRAELDEARREQAAAAEREARRENLALADRMMGSPLQHMSRAQAAVGEARAKVTDLEDQLERARGVLHQAAEQYVHWQESAEQLQATVSRSDNPDDMLAGARKVLTDAQISQMAAARSRALGPRGKGHGGLAVRSEVTCAMCIKYGATPEQSFLIHADPAPPSVPAVPSEDEREWLDSFQAERRGGRTPMIYR